MFKIRLFAALLASLTTLHMTQGSGLSDNEFKKEMQTLNDAFNKVIETENKKKLTSNESSQEQMKKMQAMINKANDEDNELKNTIKQRNSRINKTDKFIKQHLITKDGNGNTSIENEKAMQEQLKLLSKQNKLKNNTRGGSKKYNNINNGKHTWLAPINEENEDPNDTPKKKKKNNNNNDFSSNDSNDDNVINLEPYAVDPDRNNNKTFIPLFDDIGAENLKNNNFETFNDESIDDDATQVIIVDNSSDEDSDTINNINTNDVPPLNNVPNANTNEVLQSSKTNVTIQKNDNSNDESKHNIKPNTNDTPQPETSPKFVRTDNDNNDESKHNIKPNTNDTPQPETSPELVRIDNDNDDKLLTPLNIKPKKKIKQDRVKKEIKDETPSKGNTTTAVILLLIGTAVVGGIYTFVKKNKAKKNKKQSKAKK